MLKPTIKITITDVRTGKNLVINRVNAVEVVSTWKTLTDTAKITLPRATRVLNGNINEIIKRGSAVNILIGYNGNYNTEFNGYVARVNAKVPFEVFCEDEMWNLKQTSFVETFKNVKLADLVGYIYKGPKSVINITLPYYKIDRVSAAKVLARLKEQYGIMSYFQNGTLHVGFAYDLALKQTVVYHLQRNVPVDGNNLEYKLKEDYKVKVKGISLLPGNKTIEYSTTDAGGEEFNQANGSPKFDGDEIVLRWYNQSKDQLKRLVDDAIKKYKMGGYVGDLTSLGLPAPQHGDFALILNREYPEQDGKYFIDKVTTEYAGEGIRKKIEFGRVAA